MGVSGVGFWVLLALSAYDIYQVVEDEDEEEVRTPARALACVWVPVVRACGRAYGRARSTLLAVGADASTLRCADGACAPAG